LAASRGSRCPSLLTYRFTDPFAIGKAQFLELRDVKGVWQGRLHRFGDAPLNGGMALSQGKDIVG
jgi:hypothetical protein